MSLYVSEILYEPSQLMSPKNWSKYNLTYLRCVDEQIIEHSQLSHNAQKIYAGCDDYAGSTNPSFVLGHVHEWQSIIDNENSDKSELRFILKRLVIDIELRN